VEKGSLAQVRKNSRGREVRGPGGDILVGAEEKEKEPTGKSKGGEGCQQTVQRESTFSMVWSGRCCYKEWESKTGILG